MRVADRAFPDIELHSDEQLDRWPVRPVVAIEGLSEAAQWDDPENLWDVNDGHGMGPNTARVGMAIVGTAKVGSY